MKYVFKIIFGLSIILNVIFLLPMLFGGHSPYIKMPDTLPSSFYILYESRSEWHSDKTTIYLRSDGLLTYFEWCTYPVPNRKTQFFECVASKDTVMKIYQILTANLNSLKNEYRGNLIDGGTEVFEINIEGLDKKILIDRAERPKAIDEIMKLMFEQIDSFRAHNVLRG